MSAAETGAETSNVIDLEPIRAREAEVCVLGAAMLGCPDLDDLLDLLDPDDFYAPEHGDVWRAIAKVHRDGNQPDVVTVKDALATIQAGTKAKLDPLRLFDMTQLVPLVAQAPYYANQVAEKAGLRRLATAGDQIAGLARRPGELAEKREQARQRIDEACTGKVLSRARRLADLIPDVLDIAERGESEALSSPWPDLDHYLGGIAPGRLVVIGARPGVGKSIAGTNLALHVAGRHDHAVLLASLEMPEVEVGQRMLAAHARVNLSRLAAGNTEEAEWAKIAERVGDLEQMPITIDDNPGQTVTAIRSAARNVQRQRDDLALVVVDYLQLVQPAERRDNRAEEVAGISRGLKLLARETGACVVAMAQLNREGARHRDGKPKLTDLRESGAIEADADQVILMHQPDDEIPELELLVDKNRHGPRGTARLAVAGHYARLDSIAWTPTSALDRSS